MRILLLGAGGFIGRHILAELLAAGHEVTAVVRRRQGLDQAFPTASVIELDLAHAVSTPVVGLDWVDMPVKHSKCHSMVLEKHGGRAVR